jgi:hypothetical protein
MKQAVKPVFKINTENVNELFKIPICYNNKTKKLKQNIIDDLELTKSINGDEVPIYTNLFYSNDTDSINTINDIDKSISQQLASYYTTDKQYLKDFQESIEKINLNEINAITNKYGMDKYEISNTINMWKEIQGETGFYEKYFYIDWEFAKELNNNEYFLQGLSIKNIISPLISLCIPIFIIIIPFFILKAKGLSISLNTYIEIFKGLIANHSITKLFTDFHSVSSGQRMYLLISAAFYLFSIYQNILVCIRFYSNMKKIHDYIGKIRKYVSCSLKKMIYFSNLYSNHKSFSNFNSTLNNHIEVLYEIETNLSKISEFKLTISKTTEIGYIMKHFYQFYENEIYNNSIIYSFGFNSYVTTLLNITSYINNNKMNKALFKNKNTNKKDKKYKPVIKQMYYPKFITDTNTNNIIKNNCELKQNMIITGPNASGKTTTLKTLFINILLSQQIGFGCYESLKFTPFEHLHCYINIPDTSSRDSLFQAEARRCKEILNCIEENNNETNFCIFDELYSGTNPEEAVKSAHIFMKYISDKKNVCCLLTTHYTNLCKMLETHKNIVNYRMKTIKENNELKYTYHLEKGISKVKGGLKVLKDMKYPKEFFDISD